MPETKFEPPTATEGFDKCAIVYRRDPVSFIYICYHCGRSFADVDGTLEHIESHFQLVQVTVTVDESYLKSECLDSTNPTDTDAGQNRDTELDIKTELMEIEEDCGGDPSEKPDTFDCQRCESVFASKFSLRSHTLREHHQEQSLECDKCGKKFKRDKNFEKHIKQHMTKGEVDWNCVGDGIHEPSSAVISPSSGQLESVQPSKQTTETPKEDKKLTKQKKKNKTSKTRGQNTRQWSTYVCHRCSETCTTLNDLHDHLDTHSTEDMLQINKCRQCKRYFRSAFDLRVHTLGSHHLVNRFKCSRCSAKFKKEDSASLKKHLEAHTADKSVDWTNIVQGICDEGKDLTSYEDVTSCNESSCELCGEKFYIKSNFDEHVRCMHSDNEHELRCPRPDCATVFTKLQCYFAHQLEHRRVGATIIETDINVLVSNLTKYIEEQFNSTNSEESNSDSYKCSLCQADRNSLFEIRRHVRERHVYKMLPQPNKPNLQEKFTCNICGLVLKRNSFRPHLMTHTDVKLFKCSTCGKTFRNAFTKMTHERLHTGEKPFQCDQCGKRFSSNSLLGAHKKAHDNTTYPCKICGRVFNVPSSYRRHVQIHRKDKSFECTICSKSFNTRVYFTRHMFKHSEKNFQCSFCENKFNTACGLKQHEKSKHNYEAPPQI